MKTEFDCVPSQYVVICFIISMSFCPNISTRWYNSVQLFFFFKYSLRVRDTTPAVLTPVVSARSALCLRLCFILRLLQPTCVSRNPARLCRSTPRRPPDMDRIGVSFLDPLEDYELIHRIGCGTYGDVFKVSENISSCFHRVSAKK